MVQVVYQTSCQIQGDGAGEIKAKWTRQCTKTEPENAEYSVNQKLGYGGIAGVPHCYQLLAKPAPPQPQAFACVEERGGGVEPPHMKIRLGF